MLSPLTPSLPQKPRWEQKLQKPSGLESKRKKLNEAKRCCMTLRRFAWYHVPKCLKPQRSSEHGTVRVFLLMVDHRYGAQINISFAHALCQSRQFLSSYLGGTNCKTLLKFTMQKQPPNRSTHSLNSDWLSQHRKYQTRFSSLGHSGT